MSIAVVDGCEIRFNQPDPAYRRSSNVSQSELKEVLRSPAHWAARYGPNAEPSFPSAAMIMGTALHCKVLEPELFNGQFYDRSERSKDLTVAELKAQLEEDGIEIPKGAKKSDLEALRYPDGKPVDKRTSLSSEDFEMVQGMADALRTHSIAGTWFDPGRTNYRRNNEISIYLDEHASGYNLPLKGRIDRLEKTKDGWRILDLKTTDDARPEVFQKKAYNLGYHIQAAFYTHLVKAAFGDGLPVEFVFCAIERKRPHGIRLYRADEGMVQLGTELVASACETMRTIKQSDLAEPICTYPEEMCDLGLPSWVRPCNTSTDSTEPLF